MHSAQVLLTHADLADRERYLNARSTLLTLLALKALPVINENDTVVNDEIKFGDNDTLGALVANLVEADVLVILTDQRGLYSADPRKDPAARFIDEAHAGDPALERMAGGAGSAIGRGGMLTKVLAAKRAAGSGASTVIAWGREPDVLLRLAAGEAIGTTLVATTPKLAARKQWMADHLQLRGAVTVDDGAVSQAARRRQEPAADRRDGGRRRVRARRRDRGALTRWRGDRARPGQLLGRRDAPDRAQAVVADRSHARLLGRARADPPRQPGAHLGSSGRSPCTLSGGRSSSRHGPRMPERR